MKPDESLAVTIMGIALSQTRQARDLDQLDDPACLMCGVPMSLTRIEDTYPGYQRRTFECQACGGAMTEWTGVPRCIN
jgi:hypothetical protein